jgi:hypothetical protein
MRGQLKNPLKVRRIQRVLLNKLLGQAEQQEQRALLALTEQLELQASVRQAQQELELLARQARQEQLVLDLRDLRGLRV